jgi:hypothetical protein
MEPLHAGEYPSLPFKVNKSAKREIRRVRSASILSKEKEMEKSYHIDHLRGKTLF